MAVLAPGESASHQASGGAGEIAPMGSAAQAPLIVVCGRVADPSQKDTDTVALRALNAKVRDDKRVDSCLLTVGDGVLLARKR